MFYANVNNQRVRPTPGARGQCPLCGEAVLAKCGDIVEWYWSHLVGSDCDPWSEPETAWHLWWKERARPDQREVVRAGHRADIVTDSGMVVELQHSSISSDEIEARESAYGRMVWLFDGRTYGFETLEFGFPVLRLEALGRGRWRWRRARRSLRAARKPVYFDLGATILRAHMRDATGYGTLEFAGEEKPRDYFLSRLGLSRAEPSSRKYVSVLVRLDRGSRAQAECRSTTTAALREFRSIGDVQLVVGQRGGGRVVEAYGWCNDGLLEAFSISDG